MATADTTARNSRADDFAADYASASLVIKEGSTVLATHTLAGFGAANVGVITASAIANAVIAASGTADNATLSDAAGLYDLTVGAVASGADVEISTLTFVSGEDSIVNSMTVSFPA